MRPTAPHGALCSNQTLSRVNIELWKTDSPALQVPEAILIQTLEKGTEGLVMRRKEEYHLWQNSKIWLSFSPFVTLVRQTWEQTLSHPSAQPSHSADPTLRP